MYLHQVTLKNIRGFSDLVFDFQRPDASYAGWTVFTGDNGSGKSTLLKAIAIGLTGRDVARSLQPSFHRWIREGAQPAEALIQLEIVRRPDDDGVAESGTKAIEHVWAIDLVNALYNAGVETALNFRVPASIVDEAFASLAANK